VLLLDEPLSNLDALLRDEMRVELKRLQESLGTTMIFVTHDQAEALILSDRVVVMEAGRLEQIGRPEEVYRRPATAFVARFLGRANFLAGTVAETGPAATVVALDGSGLSVVSGPRPGLVCGEPVRVAIRQESIRLEPARAEVTGPNDFAATIVFHAFAGQAHHYVAQLGDGRELEIATPGGTPPLARGSGTRVAWNPDDVILLPGGPVGDSAP
jgi:putative spermidine/putrescine transport system ATP-binding protein